MLCTTPAQRHHVYYRCIFRCTPTGQYREERGLARAVDPEQPEALPLGDAQRGGLHGYLGPEAGWIHLAHAIDLWYIIHHRQVPGQAKAEQESTPDIEIARAARG